MKISHILALSGLFDFLLAIWLFRDEEFLSLLASIAGCLIMISAAMNARRGL